MWWGYRVGLVGPGYVLMVRSALAGGNQNQKRTGEAAGAAVGITADIAVARQYLLE
jgi:hypothetical protein